jgi:hypothetical protein
MEAVRIYETSIVFCEITRRNIPEDCRLYLTTGRIVLCTYKITQVETLVEVPSSSKCYDSVSPSLS